MVDNKEFSAAEQAARENDSSTYTHKFGKPFEWEGNTYEELIFDFGKLTGKDALAIENELAAKGKSVIAPAFSGDYLMCMASRAAGIGSDAFLAMSIADYNRIRSRARSFLLKTEL
jgi:hypothetical protein